MYIDPAWTFKTYSDLGKGRSPEKHYSVMNLEDMKALAIPDLLTDNAAVFMWATWPTMPQALELGAAWGLVYSTCAFLWAKTNKKPHPEVKDVADDKHWFFGMGYNTRCLSGNTLIYVQDIDSGCVEEIEIQSLAYRDISKTLIHTHNGWRKITAFQKNEATPTVRIDTRLGTVYSSHNHRWFYKRLVTHRRDDNDSLRTREHKVFYGAVTEIENHRDNATSKSGNASVNLLFSETPIEAQKPIENLLDFRLTTDLAWLLGLFVAEGNYGGSTGTRMYYNLHKNETDIGEHIKKCVNDLDLDGDRYFNKKIPVRQHFPKTKQCQILMFSSARIKELICQFVLGTGAHGKRLNLNLLLQTSVAFRQSFLEGILEGDGTKLRSDESGYKRWKRIGLCNEGLIEDIQKLSYSLGVMSVTRKPYLRGSSSNKAKKTLSYSLEFISPRNKSLKLDEKAVNPVRIDNISESILMPTYDISVDGEQFIAGHLISHNSNTEPCLLFTRGKPSRKARNVRQLVIAPVGEHSAKPEKIYPRIEALTGSSYIELFARKTRAGWTSLGNEIDGLDLRESIPKIVAIS